MDEIKTDAGTVVGSWNGKDVKELMSEIARIKKYLMEKKLTEKLDSRMMPHREQLHKDLLEFKAYHLWGCDVSGQCLVGTNANRIESEQKVLSFSLVDHH